jgi:hypothetical protein
MAKGSLPTLVTELERRQTALNSLEARLAALRRAPSVLSREVRRRLERETLARLGELREVFSRNPAAARKVMEKVLEGKLTFTPIETDE